jgi:hypothetical protein
MIFFVAKAQNNSIYFPELEGWKKPDSLSSFNPNNLKEVLGDSAHNFLLYDFEQMTVGDYKNGDKLIIVNIFRHESPEDAFGIYSMERPEKATCNEIGAQEYEEDAKLSFIAGRYYIKILSSGKRDMEINSVRLLGKTIAGMIDPQAKLPSEIAILPESGKIPNSEQFVNNNFLGYSFLNNAFVANYNINGFTFSIFVIRPNSSQEAQSVLSAFLKNNAKEHLNIQQGIFDVNDKYNGAIKILWKKVYICGIYNTTDTKIMQDYIALLDINIK